jgi:hypothetical protein
VVDFKGYFVLAGCLRIAYKDLTEEESNASYKEIEIWLLKNV